MPTHAFHVLDDSKKQVLIAAAIQEFESLPYDRVSIFNIARNAGISRSGLYYYFKDKGDIYRYLIQSLYRPFLDSRRDDHPKRDLFHLCREFFIFLADYNHTTMKRFLCRVLRDMKSVDMETLLATAKLVKSEKGFRDVEQIADLTSLRTRSTDEVVGLLILLQTLSHHILLKFLDGELSYYDALAQLDRGFDLLRHGFVQRPSGEVTDCDPSAPAHTLSKDSKPTQAVLTEHHRHHLGG